MFDIIKYVQCKVWYIRLGVEGGDSNLAELSEAILFSILRLKKFPRRRLMYRREIGQKTKSWDLWA